MSENASVRTSSASEHRLQPNATPARRVLGDVSPNVRPAPVQAVLGAKAMAGSPLKRSFTPNLGDDRGFQYFKKRKMSSETPLSQMGLQSHPSNLSTSTTTTTRESQTSRGCEIVDLADEDEHVRVDEHMKVQPHAGSVPTIQHAGPTQPNSPTGSGNEADDSAERRSFSSLINYDPSSQTMPGSQAGFLFTGPSRAELLRLRLRVAMYKVQTNQVATPFADLQVEKESPSSSEPSSSLQSMSAEEHVALLRREAQMVSERSSQRSYPKLTEGPILRPTGYSSRMIYSNSNNLPSSPPPVGSPERQHYGVPMTTPGRTKMNSSDEQELTSSIVKGRVAEGLLGLRNAGTREGSGVCQTYTSLR